MREVDTRFKVTGHTGMVSKLPAVVIGQGMYPVDVGPQALYNRTVNGFCGLADDRSDDCIPRLALEQGHQGAPVMLTDDRVALPVADAPLTIYDSRALINRDLVGDTAPLIIAAAAFAADLAAAQAGVQVAA